MARTCMLNQSAIKCNQHVIILKMARTCMLNQSAIKCNQHVIILKMARTCMLNQRPSVSAGHRQAIGSEPKRAEASRSHLKPAEAIRMRKKRVDAISISRPFQMARTTKRGSGAFDCGENLATSERGAPGAAPEYSRLT